MATMCRVIMARSRSRFQTRSFAAAPVVAMQLAMLPVSTGEMPRRRLPETAAAGGGAANPQPTLSGASSAGKAAAAAQGQGPTLVPADFSKLRIEPGDLLNVSVYDAPEFANLYRVDIAGDLMLPLCGKVNVLGLTLPEAALRTLRRLSGTARSSTIRK